MTHADKRRFDALQVILRYWWGEFQEKTRLEWRLSFAIWATLATIIGSILTGKLQSLKIAFLPIWISVFLIILLALHFWFLSWIQKKLRSFRENIVPVLHEMYTLLPGLPIPLFIPGNRWKQPSLFVQIGISLVLEIFLLLWITVI